MGWKTLCELQEWIALATVERREVAVLLVALKHRGENGMIVVYRFDDLSHSHPLIQIQSDPLFSSVSGLFDLAVGTICVESPRTGSRTCDHHRCATHNLTSRPTSSNCCTAMLISVRDWQKNAHLRDSRTWNVKDEMRNMEYETLQV